MPAKPGFADRLAYVRWLRNRGRVVPETDGEFAAFLGITGGWIAKWKVRPDAPRDRKFTQPMLAALHHMGVTEAWLLDGVGSPPELARWPEWERDRARHAQQATTQERGKFYGTERSPTAAATPKRAAGGARRRKPD